MKLGLDGKRALVAAGTRGLGLASAAALVDEGASVSVCGRDAATVATVVDELTVRGTGRVTGRAVDVTDEQAVASWVQQSSEELGGVDIVVANAGQPPKGMASEFTLDDYRAAIELNMLSSIGLVQSVLPFMREQGAGRIILIGSRAVRQPIPMLALSNTARTGLVAYMKSLVRDLGPSNITINMVAPGSILTERMKKTLKVIPSVEELSKTIPLGRYGRPEEFGATVAFLASEHAGFITGTVLPIDGGSIQAL